MRTIFGLTLALILTIIPLPFGLQAFRPPWVLLYILCIELYHFYYFRLFWVILLGLLVDAMVFSPLGLHALSYVISTWVAISQLRRFRMLSAEHQMIWIGLFCLTNEGVLYAVNVLLGFEQAFWPVLFKSILSMLCWPLVKRFYVYSRSHAMINKLSTGVTYEL